MALSRSSSPSRSNHPNRGDAAFRSAPATVTGQRPDRAHMYLGTSYDDDAILDALAESPPST